MAWCLGSRDVQVAFAGAHGLASELREPRCGRRGLSRTQPLVWPSPIRLFIVCVLVLVVTGEVIAVFHNNWTLCRAPVIG